MQKFKRKLKWYFWKRLCFLKKLTVLIGTQFVLPYDPLDDHMISVVRVGFYYGVKPDGIYSKFKHWIITLPYKKEDEKEILKAIFKAYKRTVFKEKQCKNSTN